MIQSAPERPAPWVSRCLETVERWACTSGAGYLRVGDELLERIPLWFREKVGLRWPILCDLGRLILAEEQLAAGAQATLWLDADCYLFAPETFTRALERLCRVDQPPHCFALELWPQPKASDPRRIKVYQSACNAFALFRAGDPFLPFYRHCAERTIRLIEGPIAPQLIGPKMLSALRGPAQLPLTSVAGSASPLVLADLDRRGGPALDRLLEALAQRSPCAALNLCGSYEGQRRDGVEVSAELFMRVMDRLDERGGPLGEPKALG